MIAAIFGILICFGLGWTLLGLVHLRAPFSWINFYIKSGLIIGLGFGITSINYFFKLVFDIPDSWFYFLESCFFGIFLILLIWVNRGYISNPSPALAPKENKPKPSNYFQSIVILMFCIFVAGFILINLNLPHGDWDSWAIWNHKARFFYRSLSENRLNIMEDFNYFSFSHADYPLLTPLSIARIWSYGGKEIIFIPSAINFLFLVAIALILYGAVSHIKNRWNALFSIIALFGCSSFLKQSAIQMADVPISYFLLCSLVLFALHDYEKIQGKQYLIMAGIFVALSAWTKNEGLLFLCSIIFARFILVIFYFGFSKVSREIIWVVVGALPVLLVVTIFKVWYYSPNDLISANSLPHIAGFLIDPDRYWLILKSFCQESFKLGKGLFFILPILILLFWKTKYDDQKFNLHFILLVIIFILTGFFIIYLTTLPNLQWHLDTSMRRLLLQILPSALFAVFTYISISDAYIPKCLKN